MVRELSPEKREKFLQAALKLFVGKGLQNSSTAEIAQEAGTASGTLFLYFPTKKHLINELVLRISRDQSEYIDRLIDPSLAAQETFFTIWNGSIRWFLDHMDAYHYVQLVRDSGTLDAEVVQESGKYLHYYYAAIQKGLEEGSIEQYPIDLIGGFLYQDIIAMMNYIQMQPDRKNPDEWIKMGFDLFWKGIKRANSGTE